MQVGQGHQDTATTYVLQRLFPTSKLYLSCQLETEVSHQSLTGTEFASCTDIRAQNDKAWRSCAQCGWRTQFRMLEAAFLCMCMCKCAEARVQGVCLNMCSICKYWCSMGVRGWLIEEACARIYSNCYGKVNTYPELPRLRVHRYFSIPSAKICAFKHMARGIACPKY